MPKEASGRHVSEIRKLLVKHAEDRLKPLGWSINPRSLNASFRIGPRRLIIRFKERTLTLTPDVSKSRTIKHSDLKGLTEAHENALKTYFSALEVVKDLYDLLNVDHMRAMAVIGQMKEAESKGNVFVQAQNI